MSKNKGKRIKGAATIGESMAVRTLNDALQLFTTDYASKYKAKFDESVEIVFRLGIDPRQSDQGVRGNVIAPSGLGKSVKVVAFVEDGLVQKALDAGADIAGNDDVIESLKNGKIDFDSCIATPSMMPKLVQLGKILGPRGLMPNPKFGTVGEDVVSIIKQTKNGRIEFKNDKSGIVHAAVGKLSFDIAALKSNINALYEAILSAKPQSFSGIYISAAYITTSQGPSIALDLASLVS